MDRPSRRALLARFATASATIVPLAGCLAEDADDPDDGDGGDEPAGEGAGDGDDSGGADSDDGDAPARDDGPLDGEDERQSVELEAHLQDEAIYVDDLRGSVGTVVIEILDENGDAVTEGRVMVEAATALLEQPQVATIGGATDAFEQSGDPDTLASNEVGFGFTYRDDVDTESDAGYGIGLRAEQNTGTLGIELLPSSDTDYVDAQENSEIIVVDESSP